MRRPTMTLPRSLAGYIWRASGWHQLFVSILSIVVFLLSTAPLEVQRRIVNDTIHQAAIAPVLWLALAYAGLAALEGLLKFGLNVYRSWISEDAVRHLRRAVATTELRCTHQPSHVTGTEISIILSEVEPVGGFVGISVSEPLLQGGLLLSVFGYLFYLDPPLALLCLIAFSPQLLFVPLMQRAINRRARTRIETLRDVSDGIVTQSDGSEILQHGRINRVFALNMGIFKLKFGMNFLMNLAHHLSVAAALAAGGWYVMTGRIEIGTVVAFISGLGKVNDPWGDVVNWAREMTVVRMKYRLIAEALPLVDAAARPTGLAHSERVSA